MRARELELLTADLERARRRAVDLETQLVAATSGAGARAAADVDKYVMPGWRESTDDSVYFDFFLVLSLPLGVAKVAVLTNASLPRAATWRALRRSRFNWRSAMWKLTICSAAWPTSTTRPMPPGVDRWRVCSLLYFPPPPIPIPTQFFWRASGTSGSRTSLLTSALHLSPPRTDIDALRGDVRRLEAEATRRDDDLRARPSAEAYEALLDQVGTRATFPGLS